MSATGATRRFISRGGTTIVRGVSVTSRFPAIVGRRQGSQQKRARRPTREPVPPEAWRRLAACTAAAALLQLDGTLITVALPSVAHSLNVSNGATAIVLSAYFLAYALALLPAGSLVDRFDARRLALLGLGLFALGAAAGAIVSSIGALVATRVVQGVGAGIVSPAALAGAVSGFPPERRGSALGIWGASAGVSNLLGPLIGGVLTVALGWRADWWALVPLTLLAAIGIVRFVPATVHGEDARHPVSSHGRAAALLSMGRLLGAAVGAGLAGAALATGVTGSTVHTSLLIGCAACLLLGLPAASRLGPRPPAAPLASEG